MRKLLVILILLCSATHHLNAQNELPSKFGLILGGGISMPLVDGNNNDFMSIHENRAGYIISAETRFYLSSAVALGFKYDYVRSSKYKDKMHVNFLAPEVVFRYNFNNGKSGVFFSIAPGYMNYEERMYDSRGSLDHNFQKGYFAADFALGYQFTASKSVNGMFKLNVLTADWGVNPDARLFNPDPDGYDDGEYHGWFKNNITFISLGFAIEIGK